MYQEEFMAVGQASIGKVNFLRKNPVGYFLASMLAGIYVGFGILLIFFHWRAIGRGIVHKGGDGHFLWYCPEFGDYWRCRTFYWQ